MVKPFHSIRTLTHLRKYVFFFPSVKVVLKFGHVVTYLILLSGQAITIEKTSTWETRDKTFETWISQLVYALIYFCDDTILR